MKKLLFVFAMVAFLAFGPAAVVFGQAEGAQPVEMYTVAPGDTVYEISGITLGDNFKYGAIVGANKFLREPGRVFTKTNNGKQVYVVIIKVGEKLVIPTWINDFEVKPFDLSQLRTATPPTPIVTPTRFAVAMASIFGSGMLPGLLRLVGFAIVALAAIALFLFAFARFRRFVARKLRPQDPVAQGPGMRPDTVRAVLGLAPTAATVARTMVGYAGPACYSRLISFRVDGGVIRTHYGDGSVRRAEPESHRMFGAFGYEDGRPVVRAVAFAACLNITERPTAREAEILARSEVDFFDPKIISSSPDSPAFDWDLHEEALRSYFLEVAAQPEAATVATESEATATAPTALVLNPDNRLTVPAGQVIEFGGGATLVVPANILVSVEPGGGVRVGDAVITHAPLEAVEEVAEAAEPGEEANAPFSNGAYSRRGPAVRAILADLSQEREQ